MYLLKQLWGGVCCKDGWGNVWTDSVQLLDLSLPHLQQPLSSFIHSLSTYPITLQVKRETWLLPLSPEITEGHRESDHLIWHKTSQTELHRACLLTWKGPLQPLWLSWWCDLKSPSRSTRSGPRHSCEAADEPQPDGILESINEINHYETRVYPWKSLDILICTLCWNLA